MNYLILAMPGRDYPVGYLIALIFFIIAVVLFIISLAIKDDFSKNKDNINDAGTDLYDDDDQESQNLDYTENFADEIVRLIEEEEKQANMDVDGQREGIKETESEEKHN